VAPLKHVWVFVLENRSCGEIIGSREAPYLNELADTYGLAAKFFAIIHPSEPNYFAMVAGSTMGCAEECPGPYRGPSLAGQLASRGLTWAGYFESIPRPGYTGGDVGEYVRRHNPFVSFSEVIDSQAMLSSIRPMTDFLPGLANPPSFSFVVPNLQHDMHSGTIREGDDWIRSYVGPVIRSAAFQDGGVVFITFDEGAGSDTSGCCLPSISGGQVSTIVVAAGGVRGLVSTVPYTTYSLLRTIEQGFDLPYLREAGNPAVSSMAEFWG
jgi:hypothetical protein